MHACNYSDLDARRESNPRPPHPEWGALTAELRADQLFFAGFLRGKGGLGNGDDLGERSRESFERRLTRSIRWRTVLLQFSGHDSLRVGCFLPETPSASCTLAQGREHV